MLPHPFPATGVRCGWQQNSARLTVFFIIGGACCHTRFPRQACAVVGSKIPRGLQFFYHWRNIMATNCPNKEKNLKECTCTYEPCERKGVCCECVSYHRRNGGKPACMK